MAEVIQLEDLGQIDVHDKVFYFNTEVLLNIMELSSYMKLCATFGAPKPEWMTFNSNPTILVNPMLIMVDDIPLLELDVAKKGIAHIKEDFGSVIKSYDNIIFINNTIGMVFTPLVKQEIMRIINQGARIFHLDSNQFVDDICVVANKLSVRQEIMIRVNNIPIQFDYYISRYGCAIYIRLKKNDYIPEAKEKKYSEDALRRMLEESEIKCINVIPVRGIDENDKILMQALNIIKTC